MTVEAVLYLVHKSRGYRIKAVGDVARIERQAHGGFAAASQKAYPFTPLAGGLYWDFAEVDRVIRWYERDNEKDLKAARLKEIKEAEPGIRWVLSQLISGKSDTLESGYELAKELKKLGYKFHQVMPVMASMCPSNIRAGIQIEYTGLYD